MMPHPRVIYFVRSGDAIKIGCTIRLEERVAQIERDIGARLELLGWIYGRFATENLIHKHLSSFDEGNEWFRDCPEVRRVISYLVDKGPVFHGLPPA